MLSVLPAPVLLYKNGSSRRHRQLGFFLLFSLKDWTPERLSSRSAFLLVPACISLFHTVTDREWCASAGLPGCKPTQWVTSKSQILSKLGSNPTWNGLSLFSHIINSVVVGWGQPWGRSYWRVQTLPVNFGILFWEYERLSAYIKSYARNYSRENSKLIFPPTCGYPLHFAYVFFPCLFYSLVNLIPKLLSTLVMLDCSP